MKRNNNGTLQTMILTTLVMSLVFLMTKVVQIPTFSGGYIHLGDCMVLLSVIILGWKLGALASGVGAAMSDLAGGYGIYVPGTFAVKALMALAFGLVAERAIKKDLEQGCLHCNRSCGNDSSSPGKRCRILIRRIPLWQLASGPYGSTDERTRPALA